MQLRVRNFFSLRNRPPTFKISFAVAFVGKTHESCMKSKLNPGSTPKLSNYVVLLPFIWMIPNEFLLIKVY